MCFRTRPTHFVEEVVEKLVTIATFIPSSLKRLAKELKRRRRLYYVLFVALTIFRPTFHSQQTPFINLISRKKNFSVHRSPSTYYLIFLPLMCFYFALWYCIQRYAAHFLRKKINWLTFELKCVSFEMKKKNHESFIYHFTFVVVNSYFVYLVDKVWKLVQKPKWLHHEKMRSDAIVENTAFQFDPFRRPTTRKVHSCLMLAYESSMQVHGD